MLALAAAALLYGIFHAIGPGHGKTIVSTFFLAKEAKLRHSLIAGYLIAIVHAVSALTIVLALFFIVRGVFSTGFESASRIVQTLIFKIQIFIEEMLTFLITIFFYLVTILNFKNGSGSFTFYFSFVVGFM